MIINSIKSNSPIAALPRESIKSVTSQKTEAVARRIFIALGTGLIACAVVISFAAVSLDAFVLSAGLIVAICTAAIQLAYKMCQNGTVEGMEKTLNGIQHLSKASFVSTIGSAGLNTAIHESGHVLMAHACYKNATPRMLVNPFHGGVTTFTKSHGLTSFGKLLGSDAARALCASAGIMASTICALFEFGLAYRLKESHPALSECLTLNGCMQILHELIYGLTTFIASRTDLAHDFMAMWKFGGIHPFIPMAMMCALPLFELAILRWVEGRDKTVLIQDFIKNHLPVKT
jgi:hypothetical protein